MQQPFKNGRQLISSSTDSSKSRVAVPMCRS
uniref:Uncharacterized protein n=1 Tax=Rhizophora mucronata TaxID=61149 RepID=A0A2P2Q382_RHIMU